MSIHILPPELASQIAAGEVVERPASVVKELVENALDAGAGSIRINIEGAGRRLIEVADDGWGIASEDLPLAVERHATSKIDKTEDLFNIGTLGFRGEALSSIGSVSRMTLTSRSKDAPSGARMVIDGGELQSVGAIGAPVGTVVRVENLFFNVPARLKFLKRDATERGHIDRLVSRYAIAYPHVQFDLQQEGRKDLATSGNGERREVIAALYGVEMARQMLEVLSRDEGLNVTGFISPTSLTRSNRREITFFVNGRPVRDAALSAALMKGYHTLIMVGRYPIAMLLLEMDPAQVDVNVHPTKAEVRFRKSDRVFVAVQGAVRRALLAHTPVPELTTQLRWSGDDMNRAGGEPGWQMSGGQRLDAGMESGEIGQERAGLPQAGTQSVLPAGHIPLLRLIGQIATTYLVAEGPDGLYLIDQHAAHERVLFEAFTSQMGDEIAAQSLLEPVAVELPPASAHILAEQLPVLGRLGFQVEDFGPNMFLVRAIPQLLIGMDPAAAVRVVVEDFEEDETPLESQVEARIIARVCKRAAIKAGQTLSPEEQRALLNDLEACQSPRTCPHGRPTMIHLSVDLLERQFGRRGAR
ncbi:MAG: DNA mismatch repair endonuclease MutL [Chloroflexota bacterium]|nr:DNA mismatch repair endonuclease MutL [Chloroflexota bacterium]